MTKTEQELNYIRALFESCTETFFEKNTKYDDSFGKSVERYGIIAALTRLSDKWNRFENLILSKDTGTPDEALKDTMLDMIVYLAMTMYEIEHTTCEPEPQPISVPTRRTIVLHNIVDDFPQGLSVNDCPDVHYGSGRDE